MELRETLADLGWTQAELARRMTADGIGKYSCQHINSMVAERRPVSAAVRAYVIQALRIKEHGPDLRSAHIPAERTTGKTITVYPEDFGD